MKKSLHYWITGASSGIGLALVRHIAAQGHHVTVSAGSLEKLQALAREPSIGGQISVFLSM